MNKIFSVSELAVMLQKLIEEQPHLSSLWLRAEISNFKKHPAGHLYFSLKDERSSIRAVMFKSRAVHQKFLLRDGMDCLVRGYISLYSRDVMVQFYAEEIIPAGTGIQYLALEELKKKMQSKGYFAVERKRTLPFRPGDWRGYSPQARHRDIQKLCGGAAVCRLSCTRPGAGEKAADTVAAGIKALGGRDDLDVVIVARGGGSVEDLAVFNTEVVAEAVFNCPKPVISAIGHEIDYTITDLVADLRAATPSAAGELAVPVKAEIINQLDKLEEKLYHVLRNRLEKEQMRLGYLAEAGIMKNPGRWFLEFQEELARKEAALGDCIDGLYRGRKQDLQALSAQLHALSPLATLARGYSISRDGLGRVLLDSEQVDINDEIEVLLYSGRLGCVVIKKEGTGHA